MELIEVGQNQKDNYNHFVISNEGGSFLQSWEWGEWQPVFGRQIFRFKVIDDGGEQIAAIQLIKMPLPLGKFYLYAPYGPVVSEKLKVKSEKLIQELQKFFSEAVFIRIEPKAIFNFQFSIFNLPIVKSANIQPASTLVIDLSKPAEQLLYEMHPKTRYNIKIAHKHGVKIEKDLVVTPRHGLYFKEVLRQIVETAKRQGFKSYPKEYYISLINFFALKKQDSSLKIHIYKALYHQQLLASSITVDFGKTRTYLFGGSSLNSKNVMAPYLLHWQSMLDAKEAGQEEYDFWGVETASGKIPGFARFKTGFGGQIKNYPGAFDIIQGKNWYRLYRVLRFFGRLVR